MNTTCKPDRGLNGEPTGEDEIRLSETSVAEYRGIRLGLSNVWEDEIDEGGDMPRRLLRGTVSVMFERPERDFDRRLAAGDELRLDGEVFCVAHVSQGRPLGGMSLRRKSTEGDSKAPPEHQRPPWLDLCLLLLFLLAPHSASDAGHRVGWALAGLLAWFWLARPGWRGLLGLFGSGLLLLQLLLLGGLLLLGKGA